jgi:tetratricopeptide (TPR) repeat protein
VLLRQGQDALDAGDFDKAANEFEQARRIAPDSKEANRGLMLSYLQAGRLGEAEEIGLAAVARWPKAAEFAHWLGLVYFKQHRNELAVVQLQHAETLDSADYDVHFDWALVLLSDGKYSDAARELEKAIKIDPKAALPHVLLGRAYQNTNRTTQAVEQFQTALRIEPSIPLGHYHLGFAYASLGRNDEAIAEYEKELQKSPDNPTVLYQLGHCQVEAGQLKSATVHLRRAVQVEPQNADAAYDLGKALLLQGDAEGAVASLRRAIDLKSSDPSPHYQLSRALEKLGKKEEAKNELEIFYTLKKAQPVTGGMAAGPVQ